MLEVDRFAAHEVRLIGGVETGGTALAHLQAHHVLRQLELTEFEQGRLRGVCEVDRGA